MGASMQHQHQNEVFEQAWKGASHPGSWANSFVQREPQQWVNNFVTEQREPIRWADNFAQEEKQFDAIYNGLVV